MRTADFDYHLPKELIAQHPVRPRHSSRLMVVGSEIEHRFFSDITDYLGKGDTLVINATKVIPAKICGMKETGGKVSIILVSKITATRYNALLIGKRLRIGAKILFKGNSLTIAEDCQGHFVVEFSRRPNLEVIGEMPLPPYIKEKVRAHDEYQTVYASEPGSIAAPTAGFHLSKEIMAKLRKNGVRIAKIVLHIGLGTFQPVKCENVEEHAMHPEFFTIDKKDADIMNRTKGRLVAVGTTTMRCLESAADEDGKIMPGSGWTWLFIYPGYRFKSNIAAMITNFHLPRSTLLMLVSAFAGRHKIRDAYELAKERRYRFYSFGDAMLLFRNLSA